MTQEPNIKVGTVLSMGTVIAINTLDVSLEFHGTRFTASFTAVEKAYHDGINS